MRPEKSRIADAAAVAWEGARERGEVFCCLCAPRRGLRRREAAMPPSAFLCCTRESPQKFAHLSHTHAAAPLLRREGRGHSYMTSALRGEGITPHQIVDKLQGGGGAKYQNLSGRPLCTAPRRRVNECVSALCRMYTTPFPPPPPPFSIRPL